MRVAPAGRHGRARAFSLYVRSRAVCKEFRTHCCPTLCVWVTNAPYAPLERVGYYGYGNALAATESSFEKEMLKFYQKINNIIFINNNKKYCNALLKMIRLYNNNKINIYLNIRD